MPEIRMNSLKSLAMNCGPLSEIIRGRASGYFSFAPCKMTSMSVSVIDSRMSQFTMYRLKPSRILTQVIERPADVEVGNIDVPVLMCGQRLYEARALLRRFAVPLRQESRLAEYSPHA